MLVRPLQLQRPDWVYFDGRVRPWDEAVFHVSSEAVVRGVNVFEGLKGYWQADGGFAFLKLREHHARMQRSARLLHIPFETSFDAFEEAIFDLTAALYRPESDLYIRATLFAVEGHYGQGTVSDLVLTGYQQTKEPPERITMGVSTWRRSRDVSLPARIKTSSNYQVARLARIEGRNRGFSDMFLLNDEGRVAESTGACLLLVRDGCIVTPPASEGALESITLDVVGGIAAEMDFDVVRRPVDRTELYIADELALCGTLAEIQPVTAVDEMQLPDESPIVDELLRRYLAWTRAEAGAYGDDGRSVLPPRSHDRSGRGPLPAVTNEPPALTAGGSMNGFWSKGIHSSS
ncbi:MAG: aminotransferase class IV [Solirubrobacterales bacterium]|nr:aminotransferase class IV [Solirubrobacterales bacterium]